MTTCRFPRPIPWLVTAAILAACADSPTDSAPSIGFLETTTDVLVLWPETAELMPGETQVFSAYSCPPDADGNADLGPDGVPGTDDDDCLPVNVDYGVSPTFLGSLSPAFGTSTTFTALEPGSGVVVAQDQTTGRTALADVFIESEPIADRTMKPCIRFSFNGDVLKYLKPVCADKVVATSFFVRFRQNMMFKATFKTHGTTVEEVMAPNNVTDLQIFFDGNGKITKALLGSAEIAGVAGTNRVIMEFPDDTGEFTIVRWLMRQNATNIPIPTTKDGKKVNDVHLEFTKVKGQDAV